MRLMNMLLHNNENDENVELIYFLYRLIHKDS